MPRELVNYASTRDVVPCIRNDLPSLKNDSKFLFMDKYLIKSAIFLNIHFVGSLVLIYM